MSTTTSTEVDDHRMQEAVLSSAKLIVESQLNMIGRIEASIEASNARVEASSAGIEALLCKIVESQAHNQQQMMEMLRILANNRVSAGKTNEGEEKSAVDIPTILANNIVGAGLSNEGARKSDVDIPNYRQNPGVFIDDTEEDEDDDIEEDEGNDIEDESTENNEQQGGEIRNCEGYKPLEKAVNQRDWGKATEYLSVVEHQKAMKDIFATSDSGFHAVYDILATLLTYDQMILLEEFLKLVPPKVLEHRYPTGDTILHIAVIEGNVRAVQALVKKNRNLTQIRARNVVDMPYVPLVLAVNNVSDAQKEMVEYLSSETRDEDPSPFSGKDGAMLMKSLILADMCDVALSICQRFPRSLVELITHQVYGISVFKLIVERPFAFLSGTKLTWWERCIYSALEEDRESVHDRNKQKDLESTKGDEENPPETSIREKTSTSNKRTIINYISSYFIRHIRRVPCVKRLYHLKLMHIHLVALVKCLFEQLYYAEMDEEILEDMFLNSGILEMAIKFRTTEFVLECFREFTFLSLDNDLLTLVARERNELIYSFMCILSLRSPDYGFSKSLFESYNCILHVCAEVAHNRQLNVVSGAAFQMQREIQWFKAIENTMLQKDRFIRNEKGETAQFLFTEKHKGLMEKGEKWMKETSGSCMVVSALIATVAFAAAFTVPGGNISDSSSNKNGSPVFQGKKSFITFAVADALALFSSITSVLMFLAVFTSRYSEEDFLKSLPQKLIIGLANLFISMATILVAFGAAFTIVVGDQSIWALITVALFGCAPVLLFGFLQFPLFFEMVRSTYWPITFGKEDNPLLEPYLKEEEGWCFQTVKELDDDRGTVEEMINWAKHSWTRITSSLHRCRI
ncbi:hypothetical protein MKX03_031876 [Papaver bracteatum]|nr:hypothetical protein MKX03_031876 [Papaver bracteatum]